MCVQAVENLGFGKTQWDKKHRRKIWLVCDFRQEFVFDIGLITFGIMWDLICMINSPILIKKREYSRYPILTLVKREPSNHLPTNIIDNLLGIRYLWLLYRTSRSTT